MFFPQNILHFEDVPIDYSKQFLYYIEFICRRACEENSEFHVVGWFPGFQNLNVFLGKFTAEQVLKSFSGRNNSVEPFSFLIF